MQIIRLMCQVCARGQQFIISFINYVTASQLLDIRRLFPRTIISFINYVTATQLLDIRRLNQRVPRAAYNSLCICRLYIRLSPINKVIGVLCSIFYSYFNFVYLIYYVYDDIKLGFVLHINYQFIFLIKRKCFFNCPPSSRVLKWPLFILYSC